MEQLTLVIHVLACVGLIGLVLVQHGKGADMGAAFGSGASGTVFGSQGSSSFLLKITSLLAATFFATSLFMGYMASSRLLPAKAEMPAAADLMQQQMNFGLSEDSDQDNNSTDADAASTSKQDQ